MACSGNAGNKRPPKRCYPSASLHGTITQRKAIRIFIVVKISSLARSETDLLNYKAVRELEGTYKATEGEQTYQHYERTENGENGKTRRFRFGQF
jgi:hypothetical protein